MIHGMDTLPERAALAALLEGPAGMAELKQRCPDVHPYDLMVTLSALKQRGLVDRIYGPARWQLTDAGRKEAAIAT